MDEILDSLRKSVEHLEILDKIFSSEDYPEKTEYLELKKEIKEISDTDPFFKFTDELYVGGKKGRGIKAYGRQMILSDIVTYIISGRGYFYASRNEETMRAFIKLILKLTNQLMLFDSLTNNVNLRKKFLGRLESKFGDSLFKEEVIKREHEALKLHDSPIGFPVKDPDISDDVKGILNETEKKTITHLENYYDSLLPKPLGLWGELLVYAYLLRQRMGYVLPLLLTQKLISGYYDEVLKVPDFILIPFTTGKPVFGIEVGAGKETQSTPFYAITGIKPATKANANNPKRCIICGKWMLFCPVAIERYSDLDFKIDDLSKPIKCLEECNKFTREEILQGKCPFAMVQGADPENYVMIMKGNKSKYHFHLRCVLKDRKASRNISEAKILTYYPYVSGLEEVEFLVKTDLEKIRSLEDEVADRDQKIKNLERELRNSKRNT